MTIADIHAERFLLALGVCEDPWAERLAAPRRRGALEAAGVYCAAGLWGAFLGTAIWWSYALVTAVQPAMILAQAN